MNIASNHPPFSCKSMGPQAETNFLSEPEYEEGNKKHVFLLKDKKAICRTLSSYLSFDVPSSWSVSRFERQWPSDLPLFQLYPEAENDHQEREWGLFLSFLQKNRMVAIVKAETYDFYVLPPSEGKGFSHATVLYRTKRVQYKSETLEHHAGEIMNVPKGPFRSDPKKAVKVGGPQKNFIRTDPSYLVTLGQTHAAWSFGAIAELVDNSRDAKASRLDISINWLYSRKQGKKIPVLSVIDDGHGMSHIDIVRMLSFGHKQPEIDDVNHIGRFGIGFKTGTMKLGRDVIVLTQTLESRSVAFLSQSFNENKENIEIPIITYCKQGHLMEVDLSIQSEASADFHLKAIKDHSPFNEYFIGEKLGLFGENGTGTQIYIWNLDEWGSDYSLEWENGAKNNGTQQNLGDILIRSRRIRSRPGQITQKVPLDYSLQAYLEVIFLEPRIKIYVQGSLVKSRPLARSLNNTEVVKEAILGKDIQLTLGRSQVEWERVNCGIFLYWHGRLIEAYKRVGGMIHNADMGRGVIGVVDVTALMDDGKGRVWVLNNKQGFQDCEAYAKLEELLGCKSDEYWDENYDPLQLEKGNVGYKPDHEWVQCNKCRKWRILGCGFVSSSLPLEWFCYMPPFNGKCETPEQQVGRGVITVGIKRSGYNTTQLSGFEKNYQQLKNSSNDGCISAKKPGSGSQKQVAKTPPMDKNTSAASKHQIEKPPVRHTLSENPPKDNHTSTPSKHGTVKSSGCNTAKKPKDEDVEDSKENIIAVCEDSTQTDDDIAPLPVLKRLRRGLPRRCKQP